MSFRILFADDSMTAQNMGKKILTDAGYDVVAVSNGAAAVKKIAEQKPDIIILDIYMPGYSGLEVCDKVRASVDTLRTPVLLTVGKMEPYKPEDANRVRADGVIIKPFEASDLLAVIKKLEERVVPRTVAMTQETVLLERPPDFTEFENPEPEIHATPATTVQGTVDVPDNMATTAAFSDMLSTESAYSLDPLPVPKTAVGVESEFSVEPSVEEAETPAPGPSFETAPPQEPAAESWPSVSAVREEVSPEPPVVEATSTKAQRNGSGEWPPVPKPTDASAADTQELEVIEPPVETAFAAPQVSAFKAYHEPELPPAAREPEVQPVPEKIEVTGSAGTTTAETPVAAEPHKFIDPGLSIDAVSLHAAPVQEENIATSASAVPAPEPAEEAKVVAESSQTSVQEEPRQDAGRQVAGTEDDFEARVAAAMSIYDEPAVERVEVESSAPVEPEPVAAEPAPVVVEEVTQSFEYTPPVISPNPVEETRVASTREWQPSSTSRESMMIASEATMVIPVYLERTVEQKQEEPAASAPVEVAAAPVQTAAPEEPAPVMEHSVPAAEESAAPAVEQSVEAHVEAALPAVAAAAAAAAPADLGANTQMISNVVDRILERLKPQMIEEISRELKQKK